MPPTTVRHGLILAAGLGTRLQPLTSIRAKPAVPLAGEPIVRHIVRWLVANGVTDIVVNLHHLPATITASLGDGSDLDARVRYSWEQPVVLGSAGGPRLALPIIGAQTFYIVNGDTLTDVNLGALESAHRSSGALLTLALTPNTQPLRYGGVRVDEASRITGFVPRGEGARRTCHFIGVQLAEADAFWPLTAGRPANSVGDVYNRLIAVNPGSVHGFLTQASFWDIGTVADYLETSAAWEQHAHGSSASRPLSVTIHPSARVTRSIVWDDVDVAAEAEVDECIVTDGVRIPPGGHYRRMIVMRDQHDDVVAVPMANRDG